MLCKLYLILCHILCCFLVWFRICYIHFPFQSIKKSVSFLNWFFDLLLFIQSYKLCVMLFIIFVILQLIFKLDFLVSEYEFRLHLCRLKISSFCKNHIQHQPQRCSLHNYLSVRTDLDKTTTMNSDMVAHNK